MGHSGDSHIKILAISDFAVALLTGSARDRQFSDIDLILACGDLQPEYLARVRAVVDAPLYYILGNHDLRHQQSPPMGCVDISLRTHREQGVKLLGIPGSRWYNGGCNQFHENEMRRMLFKLTFAVWKQLGVDIIISHAPPRHVGDAEDRCHRGFKSFHSLINRFCPAFFLHGHIHRQFSSDEGRITWKKNTQIINCCGYYVFTL